MSAKDRRGEFSGAPSSKTVSGRAKKAPAFEPSPRMGGIALKNGLVLLTERHWAAAIREKDGTISVASGKKPRLPGSGGTSAAVRDGAEDTATKGGDRVAAARPVGKPPAADLQVAQRETERDAGAGDTAADAGPSNAATEVSPGRTAGASSLSNAATEVSPGKTAQRATATEAPGDAPGIPLVRGLGRFGESLIVLGLVKSRLPNAVLPLEGERVMAALAASFAATSAVKALRPKSALVQEAGAALAAFVPAVLAVKDSAISGYHGAEHKVIGAHEEAQRRAARRVEAEEDGATSQTVDGSSQVQQTGGGAGGSVAAAKEHDRCGTNLVGPYLLATVATNVLARGRSGRKTPAASAAAGAASLALALEAFRWATKHGDSILARLMLSPGRAIQRLFTTKEPTPEQLEVGERALAELLRLEGAAPSTI